MACANIFWGSFGPQIKKKKSVPLLPNHFLEDALNHSEWPIELPAGPLESGLSETQIT